MSETETALFNALNEYDVQTKGGGQDALRAYAALRNRVAELTQALEERDELLNWTLDDLEDMDVAGTFKDGLIDRLRRALTPTTPKEGNS